jgi:glutathione S-transferase
MKLYYAPGACSLAVHIALSESGLPFTLAKADVTKHTLAQAEEGTTDFYAISPRGYVPLLELDDGSRHTEVASLLMYVGDQMPGNTLLAPVGTRARLDTTGWLVFVATELHRTFSPWLWHKDTAQSTADACRAKLDLRFRELDAHLATRDYLVGSAFTVADAYCFTIVNWARFLRMPLDAYPGLMAYQARVEARPKVRDALRAEGLLRD